MLLKPFGAVLCHSSSNKGKEENRHRRFRFLLSYQFDNDNQTDNRTLMLSEQIIIKLSAGAHTKVKG